MGKSNTGFEIGYSFAYNGYEDDSYYWEVTDEAFCNAVRSYFDKKGITLDGTDNAIWNAIAFLGDEAMESIFQDQEEWLKEKCRDIAFEDFKDYVDYYIGDDERA